MNIFGLNITSKAKETVIENKKPERQKSSSTYHQLQQKYETREDLKTLRLAIENAGNTETYNRYELHQIYRRILRDPELSAQWNTRVMKTLDKEFHIETIDGEVNNVAIEVFKAPWFYDFVRLVLDQYLWGFTLIEFGPWEDNAFERYTDNTGRLHTPVEPVDRDYVKPEYGTIVDHYGDNGKTGISVFRKTFEDRLLFVGKTKIEDSILYKLSAYLLMKENAHQNWSEWAEVFAMDMRIGKTDAQGPQRDIFLKSLRDMGSNGYGVIDIDDVVDYVGVNRQDAYQVYQAFLEYCDGRIAKLIFGQDVVTNNTGRVVGNAGVELSNMYGDSDAKLVQWVVNKELIPMMIRLGAELDGVMFKYDTTEKLKLSDRAKVDKAIADMGFQIEEEYLERTYGVDIVEFIGVPYTGTEKNE